MGEVRVKVKLTNTLDRALARRGQMSSDEVRSYEVDALIDTGAVSSVVPPHTYAAARLTGRRPESCRVC